MRRTSRALLAASLALGVVAAAPAVAAYDKKAYSYAATHMVEAKQIPKALGTYKPGIFFNASTGAQEIYLCSVGDTDIRIRGAKMNFMAGYASKQDRSDKSVNVSVYQFASSSAAIKAFRALERESKKCTGKQADSSTSDDGVTYSWTKNVTNGKVPSVTIVGVESIFINNDYESGSSDSDEKFLSDTYTVYSLVNDAVVATSFYLDNASSLSKAQQRAANLLAFRAVGAWVG
jgi:hypothetical protein